MKIDKSDAKTLIYIKLIDLSKIIFQSITWISGFYFGSQSIASLAGNNTTANFAISYFTSADSTYGLPWIAALAGLGYGFLERKIRQQKTRHFQDRITKLERIIDRKRSTSGLTTDGQTHPKDKI